VGSPAASEKGGRTISVVTDAPLCFVGGGNVDAKPREGFEVAVIVLDVDSIGLGTGSLAAAARVKPGGPAGLEIDDYSETPVKLVTVRKSYRPWKARITQTALRAVRLVSTLPSREDALTLGAMTGRLIPHPTPDAHKHLIAGGWWWSRWPFMPPGSPRCSGP